MSSKRTSSKPAFLTRSLSFSRRCSLSSSLRALRLSGDKNVGPSQVATGHDVPPVPPTPPVPAAPAQSTVTTSLRPAAAARLSFGAARRATGLAAHGTICSASGRPRARTARRCAQVTPLALSQNRSSVSNNAEQPAAKPNVGNRGCEPKTRYQSGVKADWGAPPESWTREGPSMDERAPSLWGCLLDVA